MWLAYFRNLPVNRKRRINIQGAIRPVSPLTWKGLSMKNLMVWLFAALPVIVMSGCAGKMDGIIRRDAKRIDIIYSDSRVSVADLIVVLPNGERFSGKPERLDLSKEMMETDSDDIQIHFEHLRTFNGNVKATLTGNRGDNIKCRFRLADTIIGFSSGGIGLCQVSDGRVIDVFF
jgi:hypothetical protein